MRADRPLCLIVPCYNEATRLQVEVFRRWTKQNQSCRLLFVDDGSSDKTIAVLNSIRDGNEDSVAVLALPKNGGKAEAVRAGILHSIDHLAPEAVGFWDADLATPLESVDQFISLLERRPEIQMVFGSRVKLLGRDVQRNPTRHYLGRVFATVVSNALRLPIYDTQCGAKIFRVNDGTRRIFADPFISKWVFDVEIIARYLVAQCNDPKKLERIIYEYPLESWMDVAGSKLKPTDFLTALWDVARIRNRY